MQKVKVWDLPTRLFHWTLVILFAGMWFSGTQGGDWMQYHIWCGMALGALIIYRLIWGVIGSQTARFSNFIKPPATIVRYLRGDISEQEQPGHNPLGGLMVVTMLLMLLTQVSTGLFSADVNSYTYDGPLVGLIGDSLAEQFNTWHKLGVNVLLALVGLHLLAILAYRFIKRQNLILPMITGYKTLAGNVAKLHFRSPLLALIVLLLCVAAVYGGIQYLGA